MGENADNSDPNVGVSRDVLLKMLGIVFGIVIVISAFIFLITKNTRLNVYQVSNIIAAYGTILLSAILAYLYSQMWETQEQRTNIQENQEDILEEQTEIQEKQQEMLETEKSAMLDLSICSSENDRCFIEISNHGNGAIKQTMLRTRVQPQSDQFQGDWKATELKRYDNGITGATVIGGNETNIRMACDLEFSVSDGSNTFSDVFSGITSYLSREGVNDIRLEIDLVSVDEYNNMRELSILEEDISVHNNMGFEEVDAWKIN
ncbi:hypothetical protein [Natrinema longum]|uniref:Uncharacterized protein n=1 Tax=Natrinema longum TaxID=370324 RepID=A0A8A2U6Q9_9EURY|nr:hypothetical protein [Natrinema longum]MBZ6494343.1 hypothetical protein [Natrinema longum]QSW84334.1 hypothetical protein J0X27_12840 [Natrinema longum]